METDFLFLAVPRADRGIVKAVGSLLMPTISIAPGLAGPTLKKGKKEAIKLQGRKGRR